MTIRWAYWKRVLAGAIFGLYIAHLLYFLNPQVDITPGRLAIVTIVYGLICGLLFGTALWVLRILRVKLFGKPENGAYRAHGFGYVVLAAFIAAALYWMHLYVFRIGYLPIGAVRVLSKATNLITATAFALLLLWVVERNADRRRSRVIFLVGVVLIAISSFFLYQRRDSYRTEKQSVVVADVGTVAGQRPIIVVAIRNLPYDWILTLSGEGSLPFFDQARSRGYFTRLEPFPATDQQALWASIATGKLPFRHGVTGRFAYRTSLNSRDPAERFLILPSGVGFRIWGLIPPVDRIAPQLPSGDVLPFWTLFERVGLHATVIDWPSAGKQQRPLPMVAPRALQRFNGAGRARDRIVRGLTADLSTAVAIRAAASNRDLTLVVGALNGFEEAQRAIHIFTNDLPPRSTMKGEVLRAYTEQIDATLASIARQFPDHLMVVVAPSGPVAPALATTPYAMLRDWISNEDPGADDGFVLISGSGIAHPQKPSPAAPEDVVPTLLYAAGLPIGRDMDGRVLTDAFTDELLRRNALSLVQTYEAKQLVVRRGGA
ncbi:MAG TPA: alkaline phosphatase family protein [Thermoanaerobaculia bacterium]|nr:alkaline phosphatase family protein [Thermoanaerobaculia bacterium]